MLVCFQPGNNIWANHQCHTWINPLRCELWTRQRTGQVHTPVPLTARILNEMVRDGDYIIAFYMSDG